MYYTLLDFVLTESPYTASNQRRMYPSRQQAWHPLPEPGHPCKLKDAYRRSVTSQIHIH